MENRERSVKWAFTAGCVGGTVSALAFQPLDVIKTRLQAVTLRGQPNPGMLHTVRSIYYGQCLPDSLNTSCKTSHRGLLNFWAGTVPSLWRCVPGIGGYFLCLSIIERATNRWVYHCSRNFLFTCILPFFGVRLSSLPVFLYLCVILKSADVTSFN
ncbi:Solute carrier family 25 member 38 [Paragonimus heterotremus]|uniref:Solute carrier family 25 member 38 n=1 Tax=Paragonimus heterotremus TaxID=100268 RepID=A0A8J4T417_9TREM|nr:Solute carrier family 25 member 38 [Paragonimus heterotremus]